MDTYMHAQAHAYSMADSQLSDAEGPHGLSGSAASHPYSFDAVQQQYSAAGQYGGGSTAVRMEDSVTSDMFTDARSAFGSAASSLMASTTSFPGMGLAMGMGLSGVPFIGAQVRVLALRGAGGGG